MCYRNVESFNINLLSYLSRLAHPVGTVSSFIVFVRLLPDFLIHSFCIWRRGFCPILIYSFCTVIWRHWSSTPAHTQKQLSELGFYGLGLGFYAFLSNACMQKRNATATFGSLIAKYSLHLYFGSYTYIIMHTCTFII